MPRVFSGGIFLDILYVLTTAALLRRDTWFCCCWFRSRPAPSAVAAGSRCSWSSAHLPVSESFRSCRHLQRCKHPERREPWQCQLLHTSRPFS